MAKGRAVEIVLDLVEERELTIFDAQARRAAGVGGARADNSGFNNKQIAGKVGVCATSCSVSVHG